MCKYRTSLKYCLYSKYFYTSVVWFCGRSQFTRTKIIEAVCNALCALIPFHFHLNLGAEHSHSYIAKEQKIVCTATLAITFDLQVPVALFSTSRGRK